MTETQTRRSWSELLAGVPFDWRLIPLNGKKQPIDPDTGELMKKWTQQAGYDVDEIAAMNGCVRAVGVLLGEKSGGLLAVDFDGPGSPEKFEEITGHRPKELPRTPGVTSGRKSRGQRFLMVDPDWWQHIQTMKFSGPDKKTVLEFRWAGCQSVIAGDHPETDGYHWLPKGSPAVVDVAQAPDWLLETMVRRDPETPDFIPTAEDAPRAEAMLRTLPAGQCEDYDNWLKVGMALHATDLGLLKAWVDWSRGMSNFDEGECLKKWESFGKSKRTSITIRTLHYLAKQHGYKEPSRSAPVPPAAADKASSGQEQQQLGQSADDAGKQAAELSSAAQGDLSTDRLDEWERVLEALVDPAHPCFEKNPIRRQIRAATAASEMTLRVSPDQIRARLIQKQRELLAGTDIKGVEGGAVARFAEKRWLISDLIAERCLTGIAAFAKVGKTKCLTEVAASLIFQQAFMGNPEWQPAPGPHQLILWWTDQPGTDSAAYLKARGLMDPDGTLHPQIVRLYTQEDNLCWDDQGLDELIRITTANPDAVLLTDSFYANVQPIYGSDQAPESGGALIDVQTFASRYTKAHICAFHSPQETGPVGVAAMRGHGSAKGVVSSTVSLHFLEHKCPSGSGKWVADKDNPHRRMVTEGRLPYSDLLVKLDGAAGTWKVIGKFQKALAELQSDDRKGSIVDGLTPGQRETLEWVGGAMGVWKDPSGVTAHQVAACKVQALDRKPTKSEVEQTRTQLRALVRKELLSETRKGAVAKYSHRS